MLLFNIILVFPCIDWPVKNQLGSLINYYTVAYLINNFLKQRVKERVKEWKKEKDFPQENVLHCCIDQVMVSSPRQGQGSRFSNKDWTFEVNKLFFTIRLFALFLPVHNRSVGITGECCPGISLSEHTLYHVIISHRMPNACFSSY